MSDLLAACEADRPRMIDAIRDLVRCESPSTDPAALEACGSLLAGMLSSAGASVERAPSATSGDHVIARWPGDGARVMLLGHFDTVWPVGQIDRMPIEERHGHLYGPGVYDMKAGLIIGLQAARALQARHPAAARPAVTLLATSDEETGAETSRTLIERLAREHDAVLVLEPALRGGGVKTSRKGVGDFVVTARGVSSHAGADPSLGASAVHELARQVLAVEALRDDARGISVNVGVFHGGTRSNVIAESAQMVVDIRVGRLEDMRRLDEAMHALMPHDPRVELHIQGGIDRPPMERTPAVARLFVLAQAAAADLGHTLTEGGTGGASDGNFTAALGVPTLDGLGAVGDGAHALTEHVVIDELPRRAALVAGLLERLAAGIPDTATVLEPSDRMTT